MLAKDHLTPLYFVDSLSAVWDGGDAMGEVTRVLGTRLSKAELHSSSASALQRLGGVSEQPRAVCVLVRF